MVELTKEILSKFKDDKPTLILNGVELSISEEFEVDIIVASIEGNLQGIIDDLSNLSANVDYESSLHKFWCSQVKKVYDKKLGASSPPLSIGSTTALSLFASRETSSILDALETLTSGNYNISNYYNYRKKKASYLLNKEEDVGNHEENVREIVRVMKLYL